MAAPRRFATLALLPLGTALGHRLGYWIDGPGHNHAADHAYLASVRWVLVAIAVVGLAAVARKPSVRLLPSVLSGAQVVLFIGQEVLELHLQGHPALEAFTHGALWWGIAAQIFVALVLVLTARLAAAGGALFEPLRERRRPRSPSDTCARCPVILLAGPRAGQLGLAWHERAPPALS